MARDSSLSLDIIFLINQSEFYDCPRHCPVTAKKEGSPVGPCKFVNDTPSREETEIMFCVAERIMIERTRGYDGKKVVILD